LSWHKSQRAGVKTIIKKKHIFVIVSSIAILLLISFIICIINNWHRNENWLPIDSGDFIGAMVLTGMGTIPVAGLLGMGFMVYGLLKRRS
jgi:hypothetical protein